MEDPLDRGLPFITADLWRLPTTPAPLVYENGNAFEPIDIAFTSSNFFNAKSVGDQAHFRFEIDLPPLSKPNSSENPALSDPKHTLKSRGAERDELDLSIWNIEECTVLPKQRSWEAFHHDQNAGVQRLALLSEAGPAAFDAVASSLSSQSRIGVLPQNYTLRCLSNLLLGRASSLFQWDELKERFVSCLNGTAVSGVSGIGSNSLFNSIIDIGSSMARLRLFVDAPQFYRQPCPAKVAVRNCVFIIISAVDYMMSEKIGSIHSLLQLQHLACGPRRLLDILEKIVQPVTETRDDKTIVSWISKCINDDVMIESDLRQVFEALLAQVSIPWCEHLAHSIGFPDPASASIRNPSDEDEDRAFLAELPVFVPPEDAVLLHETIEAVQILRRNSPLHPLLTDRGVYDALSPFDCFRNANIGHADAIKAALLYEARHFGARQQTSFAIFRPPSPQDEEDVWTSGRDHLNYLTRLGALMVSHVETSVANGGQLRMLTLAACRASHATSDEAPLTFQTSVSAAPLDRVRPLISAQHRLVNAVLLRQLFTEHHLSDHFQVQWQFHLFGNGEFVTRLSTALFSADVQSSERRRGKIPNSEAMGLRLGTAHEDRWPPASSELQLTLMGILAEAYTEMREGRALRKSESTLLPGALSFAIRQLPEEDIDRVLDPNSIYALDFLRLQYIAKSPLDAIFTSSVLESYDQIFRFLLRLLRLVHITATILRNVTKTGKEAPSTLFVKAAIHSRTFVTVLAQHIIDVGINAPWKRFVNEVHLIEQHIDQGICESGLAFHLTTGVQGLRQLHQSCLGLMRGRLFLKRKQENVRIALETALSAVLKTAFASQAGSIAEPVELEEGINHLHSSIQHILSLLQDAANSVHKSPSGPESDDAEMAKLLLLKLNWNGVYNTSG